MTTNEQARADAIADAETLREFVRRHVKWSWRYRRCVGRGGWAGDSLRVIDAIAIGPNDLKDCGWRASESAHFAFRAVPGLRGRTP